MKTESGNLSTPYFCVQQDLQPTLGPFPKAANFYYFVAQCNTVNFIQFDYKMAEILEGSKKRLREVYYLYRVIYAVESKIRPRN